MSMSAVNGPFSIGNAGYRPNYPGGTSVFFNGTNFLVALTDPNQGLTVWEIDTAGAVLSSSQIVADVVGSYYGTISIFPIGADIYVVYHDGNDDIAEKKSNDGGATWSTPLVVRAGTIPYHSESPMPDGSGYHVVACDYAANYGLYHHFVDAAGNVSGATTVASGYRYYNNYAYVDDAGVLHVAWSRYNAATSSYEGISYVKFDGTNWMLADGTVITPPVAEDNVVTGGYLVRNLTADENGNPIIILYNQSTAGSELWKWDSGTGSWQSSQIPSPEPTLPETGATLEYYRGSLFGFMWAWDGTNTSTFEIFAVEVDLNGNLVQNIRLTNDTTDQRPQGLNIRKDNFKLPLVFVDWSNTSTQPAYLVWWDLPTATLYEVAVSDSYSESDSSISVSSYTGADGLSQSESTSLSLTSFGSDNFSSSESFGPALDLSTKSENLDQTDTSKTDLSAVPEESMNQADESITSLDISRFDSIQSSSAEIATIAIATAEQILSDDSINLLSLILSPAESIGSSDSISASDATAIDETLAADESAASSAFTSASAVFASDESAISSFELSESDAMQQNDSLAPPIIIVSQVESQSLPDALGILTDASVADQSQMSESAATIITLKPISDQFGTGENVIAGLLNEVVVLDSFTASDASAAVVIAAPIDQIAQTDLTGHSVILKPTDEISAADGVSTGFGFDVLDQIDPVETQVAIIAIPVQDLIGVSDEFGVIFDSAVDESMPQSDSVIGELTALDSIDIAIIDSVPVEIGVSESDSITTNESAVARLVTVLLISKIKIHGAAPHIRFGETGLKIEFPKTNEEVK